MALPEPERFSAVHKFHPIPPSGGPTKKLSLKVSQLKNHTSYREEAQVEAD